MDTMSVRPERVEPDDDGPGGYWRSPKTIAAGLVLALVAGAGAWLHATRDDTGPAAVAAATADGTCAPAPADTTIPTSAPATQWTNIDGAWLATSAEAGPAKRDPKGAWSCYARSASGALLALWDIGNRLALTDDYAGLVERQVAPGAGQVALLKQAQQPPDRLDPATPRGFRIDSFTPAAAELTVWKHQAGQDFLITGRVKWSDDAKDWVLTPQPNGDTAIARLTSAAPKGFLAWGPHS